MKLINEIIMVVSVFIIAIMIGISVFNEISKESYQVCNEKYGVCNWKWNKTTGTHLCKGIGECWQCVPINNIIKSKSNIIIPPDQGNN